MTSSVAYYSCQEMLTEKKVITEYLAITNPAWITSSLSKMIIEKHSLYSKNAQNGKTKTNRNRCSNAESQAQLQRQSRSCFMKATRDAWKGLKMLTNQDQTKKESSLLTEEGSADRLNCFCARFDNKNFSLEHNALSDKLAKTLLDCPLIEIKENDTIRVLILVRQTLGKLLAQTKPEHHYSRNAFITFCISSISPSNYQPPSTIFPPSGKQVKLSP